MNILRVKKTRDVKLPTYGSAHAGYRDFYVPNDHPAVTIQPGTFGTFDLGLILEIPVGYGLIAHSRSGMGFKHQVRLSNCTGLIDADYRTETLKAQLFNDGDRAITVSAGDRIIQARLEAIERFDVVEVDEIDTDIDRGGGLGSTGGFGGGPAQ